MNNSRLLLTQNAPFGSHEAPEELGRGRLRTDGGSDGLAAQSGAQSGGRAVPGSVLKAVCVPTFWLVRVQVVQLWSIVGVPAETFGLGLVLFTL